MKQVTRIALAVAAAFAIGALANVQASPAPLSGISAMTYRANALELMDQLAKGRRDSARDKAERPAKGGTDSARDKTERNTA